MININAAKGNTLANACGTRSIEADQPACAAYCMAQNNTPAHTNTGKIIAHQQQVSKCTFGMIGKNPATMVITPITIAIRLQVLALPANSKLFVKTIMSLH